MEHLLSRLWEICDGASGDDQYRPPEATRTEAHHLWKTLETVVATLKPNELRVNHSTFSKVIACIHAVLQQPSAWQAPPATEAKPTKSIYECTNRVLVKIGCRGEDEREAIICEGFITSLVQSLRDESLTMGPSDVASSLHVFQTLAFDTKHRVQLMNSDAITVTLSSMRKYQQDLSVQSHGCKFLQFMAYEESTKEIIIRNNGISATLSALDSFASDPQLATSASDVLYFLSLELEHALVKQEAKLARTVEGVFDHVMKLLRLHPKIEQIQIHGMAILLTFATTHSQARLQLCDAPSLWKVCIVAVDTSVDTAADTIELLRCILEDSRCFEELQNQDDHTNEAQDDAEQLLSTLLSKLRIQQRRMKARESTTVIDRLETIMRQLKTDRMRQEATDTTDTQSSKDSDSTDTAIAQLSRSTISSRDLAREDDDDSQRYLDQDSPVRTKALTHAAHDDTPRIHDQAHDKLVTGRGATTVSLEEKIPQAHVSEPQQSTDLYQRSEAAHTEKRRNTRPILSDNDKDYDALLENYKIVVRRAQEQSKLLNIQNARIRHHMDVHQQVLERVRTLEAALSDAQRKHQVERELRLAEVAQSEKISFSLHEAMSEIQNLNKQNSTASRELVQKEKQRVDYQLKASSIRQQQQKLEYERDDAVIQMLAMKTEQKELAHRLEELRREANESLRMREEDVDAPRPSAFCEMLSLSPTSRTRKVSNYTLTTKRVTQESSRHLEQRKSMHAGSYSRAVRPADASLVRKASVYSGQVIHHHGSENIMMVDGAADDDSDEYMMEPPKEEMSQSFEIASTQKGLDKYAIERTLRAAYMDFEQSPDSTGVHVATVRRFFQDCGIIQPPLVPGDVDTILTRVLNQAQENRRRVIVRKDFTMPTYPGGMGTVSAHNKASEAKRYRFFDEEAFFEAVTLLAMRRFPRFDAKKALDVFIADYLHPMQRQVQQQQQLLMHRRSSTGTTTSSSSIHITVATRSGSLGSVNGSTTKSASSPTAACIGILKTVLNGLALHVGRDDEAKQADPRFLSKSDTSGNSLLLAGTQHGRKPRPDDVIYSMLEMHAVLAREYKPLATICEFYSAMHHTPRDAVLKDESVTPLSFELVLTFAMDFEIIPSFMDRISLKHLHSEVSGFMKKFLAMQKKLPPPHVLDVEMLKKVAFSMLVARLAMELFGSKREYETPEKQITALMQWMDNSVGREKIQKKAMLPIVIRFSRKLYALRN